MKFRIGAVALAAFLVVGDIAFSEDQQHDPQAMMRKMAEAMELTEHHRALGDLVGTYDVKLEVKMPGMPPAAGTAEVSWLMPKRWLKMELKAPGFMGQNYESFVIFGYDKVKKKYVSTVVDSMSPGMLRFEGVVVDPTGKVQVQYGTLDEYLTGEHDKPVKYVTRRLSADKFVFEVWDLGIGEAGKPVIVETFTRRAKKD